MTQFARPASDISAGAWSPQPLWTHVDVGSFGSDIDFVESFEDILGTAFEIKLASIPDPATSAGHVIRVRTRYSNFQGSEFFIELYQGATQKAIFTTGDASGSFSTGTYTLTGAEADSITDYSDLRLRVTTASGLGGGSLDVSWLELETPDATPLFVLFRSMFNIFMQAGDAIKKNILMFDPTVGHSGGPAATGSASSKSGATASAAGIKSALASGIYRVGVSGSDTGVATASAVGSGAARVGVSSSVAGSKNAIASGAGRLGAAAAEAGKKGATSLATARLGAGASSASSRATAGTGAARVGVSGQATTAKAVQGFGAGNHGVHVEAEGGPFAPYVASDQVFVGPRSVWRPPHRTHERRLDWLLMPEGVHNVAAFGIPTISTAGAARRQRLAQRNVEALLLLAE